MSVLITTSKGTGHIIIRATACVLVNVMDYTEGYKKPGHSSKDEKTVLFVRAAACELVK